MFSSTVVATSAKSDCSSHETGNRRLRTCTPTTAMNGIVAIVTTASRGLTSIIWTNTTTATAHWARMTGAVARYIWTDRTSEFDLAINSPDCTRSKNENDRRVRCW